MERFLGSQIDYVCFLYGLGFILLAAVALALRNEGDSLLPWRRLALFGLLRGAAEWLELIAPTFGDPWSFQVLRALLVVASFVALIEFARAAIVRLWGRGPGKWVLIPVIWFVVLGLFIKTPGTGLVFRYFPELLGGLLATLALFIASQKLRGSAAVAVALSAVFMAFLTALEGCEMSYSTLESSSYLSDYINVLRSQNNSIYYLRGLIAVCLAATMWGYYHVSLVRTSIGKKCCRHAGGLALALSVILALGWLFTAWLGTRGDREFRNSLMNETESVASAINPDRTKKLTASPKDIGTADYERLQYQLRAVDESRNRHGFIRLLSIKNGQLVTLVGTTPTNERFSPKPGTTYEDASPDEITTLRHTGRCIFGPHAQNGKQVITAMSFVKGAEDISGNSILAMDVEAEIWQRIVAQYRLVGIMTSLLMCVSALTIFAIICSRNAARDNEAKFRSLVENSNDWIWEFDDCQRFTYCSPKITSILGLQPQDVIGLTPLDLLSEQHTISRREEYLDLFATPRRFSMFETAITNKNGDTVILESSGTPIFDEAGRFRGYRGISRDVTARKIAEKALQESEERYRLFTNNASDVIWTINSEMVFTYISPSIEQFTGYKPEELIGTQSLDLVDERSRNLAIDVIGKALAADTLEEQDEIISRPLEISVIHKNGTVIWGEISTSFLRDENGKLVGIAGVTRDITERKSAEKALAESERFLKSVFDGIQDGICVVDSKMNVLHVNSTMERMYSHALPLIGKKCYEVYHGRKITCEVCPAARALRLGTLQSDIVPMMGPEGRKGWVELYAFPIMDDDGQVKQIIEYVRDVTERKQVEDSLQYRLAFENLITTVSANFINIPTEDIDKGIEKALEAVGEFEGVDRAYVFLFDDGKTVSNTHEWCADGIEPQIETVKRVDIANFGWFFKRIENLETIHVPRVEDLPDEANAEKQEFLRQDIKSMLSIPLVYHGKTVGFVGFDAVTSEKTWSDDSIALLRVVGEILLSALERKRAEEALKDSEHRMADIINFLPDATFAIDLEGRVIAWNKAMEELTGLCANQMLGKDDYEYSLPFYGKRRPMLVDLVMDANPESVKLYPYIERDNDTLVAESYTMHLRGGVYLWGKARPLYDSHGNIVGAIEAVRDVTERKRNEEYLRTQTSAMHAASDQILITDAEGRIEFVNLAFERETGYTADEVMSKSPSVLKSGKHDPAFYSHLWNTVKQGQSWHGEIINRRKDGSTYVEDMTITPVKNDSGVVEHFIAIKRNITEKKVYEEQLDHLAHHDPLTGLPNRLLFSDRLTQKLAQARRQGSQVAVMFLDLDRFKVINDTLGHNVGDLLLKCVAERLTLSLREVDTIARMGGDEFTVILSDVGGADDAIVVAHKILDALTKPFIIDGNELFASTSIGISVFPTDGRDVESLVKNADSAMYRAKESGRNNYYLYTDSLNTAAMDRMKLERNLRNAVENNEFVLYYQPRVDMKTGKTLGIEALIRWQHPEMGIVPPSQFLSVAEDTGLIVPITELVLRSACLQNKAWQDEGYEPMEVAVNISARVFQQGALTDMVSRVLKETNLAPKYLDLEVTESTLMEKPDLAAETLSELKAMGVRISIDDFGTGYSSLASLNKLPLNAVKIDRSFVRDINTNNDNAAVAQAIVVMAHSLKLSVIAEGVETLEQLELLRALGCDEMQGYFVSRPVSPEELTQMLSDHWAASNNIPPAA